MRLKSQLALAAALSLGCALAPGGPPPEPTPVWIRSHNRSAVEVYLLCGSSEARWLGAISEQGSDGFEIPAGQRNCARGLNFFLVVRNLGRGYWVGPFRPQPGELVDLVIEKYAGAVQRPRAALTAPAQAAFGEQFRLLPPLRRREKLPDLNRRIVQLLRLQA